MVPEAVSFLHSCVLLFCIEAHLNSPFLCSAAPSALSCEFTGHHSHTDECVSVKRAGMAVTSPGTAEKQTTPSPPTPHSFKEAGAGTTHRTQTLQSQKHK